MESQKLERLIKVGDELFKMRPEFELGVADLEQLPTDGLMEIAFAGRSNVGKSSLINAVTKVKGLARASNTPGRTQQLNYFKVDDACHLVDLPGYGYAQAPEKMVQSWTRMIHAYLRGRVQLRRVFLLIDARHGIKEVDLKIMKMLDAAAVCYQIILTKCDKISRIDSEKVLQKAHEIGKTHVACYPEIIVTSSEKNINIDLVRAEIAKVVEGI